MSTFYQKEQQTPLVQLTPEQELQRKRDAQDLLKRLQFLLKEGESPALDILSESLQKVEELTLQTSRQSSLDSDIRSALEDISALLLAARQTAKHKGLADRLQRIAEESQKALGSQKPGLPGASQASKYFYEFMNTWRPVFYLLISTKDFRILVLDSIRIIRRVVYSYTEDISDEPTEKFVEGESVQEVAESVKEEVEQKGTPEMSDEEWERIQYDLQRVLAKLAKEPAYRQGMENFFNLLDMFQRNLLNMPVTADVTATTEDIHIRRAMGETEELISTFSGRDTFEDFKFHFGNLVRKAKEDERFHAYLCELKEFILKAKSEEEIRTEEFKEQSKHLAKRGRKLMQEFKEDDLRPFLDSANQLIENMKNDEMLQLLRHHAGIVQSDLSYADYEGKLHLDTDLLTRLQKVLLPVLIDALKYIPVPRISSSDPYRDFWLDQIVLCSYDIIPENIRFHLETDSEFSFQDVEMKSTHTHLVIKLNHFRTELKDVEFYYNRKSFPALEDSGRVTFRIKGEGANLTITYKVEQGPEEKVPRITEGKADFDISDLDIEFDLNTIHHTLLVPMLKNLFKPQLKQQIEKQVEDNLGGLMAKLGDLMMNTLSQTTRPFLSGLDYAKTAIKSSNVGQLYQQRREKLE